MRRFWSLLGLALAFLACSSDDERPADASVRSGSRLQARGWQVDGKFVFDGFYDLKLGFTCRPAIASDGARRCVTRDVLPGHPSAGAIGLAPITTSPDCTAGRVIAVPKTTCHDPSRFVEPGLARPDADPNTPQADLLRLGPPVTTKLHQSGFDGCVEVPADPELDYLEEGAALAPSELVLFSHVSDAEVSPGLRALYLEGEDGSRAPTDVYLDVARNQPCRPGRAEDGSQRCLPESAFDRDASNFADDACTMHALVPYRKWTCDSLCDPTTGREALPFDEAVDIECQPSRTAIYAAGAKGPTGLHHDDGGKCVNNSVDATTADVRAAGDRLPPATFPALAVPAEDECVFAKASDGKAHCLPADAARRASGIFADPACSQPVFLATRRCGTPKYVRVDEGEPCDATVKIFEAAAIETVYGRSGAGCAKVTSSNRFFTAGAEIAPATFPEAVLYSR